MRLCPHCSEKSPCWIPEEQEPAPHTHIFTPVEWIALSLWKEPLRMREIPPATAEFWSLWCGIQKSQDLSKGNVALLEQLGGESALKKKKILFMKAVLWEQFVRTCAVKRITNLCPVFRFSSSGQSRPQEEKRAIRSRQKATNKR